MIVGFVFIMGIENIDVSEFSCEKLDVKFWMNWCNVVFIIGVDEILRFIEFIGFEVMNF